MTPVNLRDSVTQHMRRDFTAIGVDQTVGEALESILARQPGGRIVYFYVVDREGRLEGVIPTRRLLMTPRHEPIAGVMITRVIAVPHTATVLDACEFFILHRLLALPVLDDNRKLLGIVDVELYTDKMLALEEPQQQDDLFQLIGVHLSESQQASPLASFRKRFPWLLCNIAGGLVAAFLSGLFEAELQKAVALALFIPVVLALAESVSIQSVSLALQTLHGRSPTWSDLGRRATREAAVGGLLGLASALLVGGVAAVWIGQWSVVVCILGGIAGGMTGAAAFGLSLPYLLRLLRRDPQVAAGPIALAAADMVTLLLYFNLARWLLGDQAG